MLPITNHPPGLHFKPGAPAEPLTNFVADKSILVGISRSGAPLS